MRESTADSFSDNVSLSPALAISTWRSRTAILIGAATLIRLLIIATTGLTDTEAYYAAWSRFPAWSYYDHPPMIAWLVSLTTFASSSAFAVRIGPVVCAVLFAVFLFRLVARMFSPRAGYFAVVIMTALPVFTLTGFLANPESPLLPLWVLFIGGLYDLREHDDWWRPLALGAVVGVAFLCKFTGVLCVPVALLYLGTSARTRRWLVRPSFYLAGVVALAIASPVIVWNYQHGWPSLQLHLVERMAANDLAIYAHNSLRFVLGQLVLFHPLMWPGLLVALVFVLASARRDERFRLLACASAPVLLFFFVMMVRAKDAEPHWTMVAYIPLIIAAAAWLDGAIDTAGVALRGYLRTCLGMSMLAITLYVVHTQSGVFVRLMPAALYDRNGDPLNEALGYTELRAAVSEEAARLGTQAVLVSNHNVLCGHILMETHDSPPLYCLSPLRTAFDFLGRRELPKDAPVIYVDSARYSEAPAKLMPGYRCEDTRAVEVVRGGKQVVRFRIANCFSEETPIVSGGAQTAAAEIKTY